MRSVRDPDGLLDSRVWVDHAGPSQNLGAEARQPDERAGGISDVPLLIAATRCSVAIFASEPIDEVAWLGFLGGYPPIVLGLGTVLFESVLED